MLNDNSAPKHFWAKEVNIVCYLKNKIYVKLILTKTPYEFWKRQKPNISYFHPFWCKCFILNTKDNLGQFDSKSKNGTFLGYYETSTTFRVYKSRILVVEETIHMNYIEPDKDVSKLDESFIDLRSNDGIKDKVLFIQSLEVAVSTQCSNDPQEEGNPLYI